MNDKNKEKNKEKEKNKKGGKSKVLLKLLFSLIVLLPITLSYANRENLKTEITTGTGIDTSVSGYEFTPFLGNEEDVLLQRFSPLYKGLQTISVRMANEWTDDVDNVLRMSILDDSKKVLWSVDVDSSEIENWHYVDLKPDVELIPSKTYYFSITCPETRNPDVCWKAFICNINLEEADDLYYNDEALSGELDLMFNYLVVPKRVPITLAIGFALILLAIWIDIPSLKETVFFKKVYGYILIIVFSFITLVMIEKVSFGDITAMLHNAVFINYLFILGIMLLIYALSGKAYLGIIITSILSVVFATINHYTIQFRGTVILPSDIYSIGTAANVAENYKIDFDFSMLLYMTVFIFILIVAVKSNNTYKSPVKVRVCMGVAAICALLPFIILSVNIRYRYKLGVEVMQDMQTERSHSLGFLLNFSENIRYAALMKPEGYSKKKVNNLLDQAKGYANDGSVTKPDNIIIIMNESLAELKNISDFETDTEYLPNFYRAAESKNSKIGQCVVSVYGGGTSCSEFEALTGCSMCFLGSGLAPYQQFVHDETDSMASLMKDYGYDTFAVHAANPMSWNRHLAYPLLGFDEFINIDNAFEDASYCRYWVDDHSMMQKVIDLYDEDDNPEFNFALTIQCHGGYDYEGYETSVHVINAEKEYPEADQYLSLVKGTDEAFGELIDDLSESDEKTLVLMFGDHLPNITDSFIEDLESDWPGTDKELLVQDYSTPFIFWANYDVDLSDIPDKLSANYLGAYLLKSAGLPMDKYNSFLYDLSKDYPIVSRSAIQDSNGEFYDYKKGSACYERLHEYEMLQYYRLTN